jgi:hypothetical protein
MGRTSKFHFPLPGRKHTSSKDNVPTSSSTISTSNNLSKAQRFLGTDNDLNIDSPTREDEHSWRYPGSRSSGMSISISESTQSTNESGSLHESQYDQLDDESGVFPRAPHGKASSTLLGQRYAEDGATSNSSINGRLRNEGSSSTLRSYYDRQKSPLSISQQTSNSSARDLALRKGFPPVIHRSPLLRVESVDSFDQQFGGNQFQANENDFHAGASLEKNSWKKPARLDLSMLFPSRKHGKKSDSDSLTQSPSSITTNLSRTQEDHSASGSGRRKLTKVSSKESLQSQKRSIRSTHSEDRRQRQTSGTLEQLYDHYESMPPRSARMDRIPESSVPDRDETRIFKFDRQSRAISSSKQVSNRESYLKPSNSEFSWKNVGESIGSPPWESSSAASVSSRNTRTSRRSASVLSNSDLKQRSVLSLSSDSEDDSETEPVRSPKMPSQDNKALRVLNGSSETPKESRRRQSQQPEVLTARHTGHSRGSAKGTPFLPIPESSIPSTPISGPWSITKGDESQTSSGFYRKDSRMAGQREKRSTKKESAVTPRKSSHQQPTPPLSPTSVEFRQSSQRSSRFMAVTKQEKALLEALRQKRARMREKIIEEHETAKSPPRIPERVASRHSSASTVSTIRGNRGTNEKQKVLLYLDTPISESQAIDTAEPSPDLSDFLSFGSDEDSTPRTSWAAPPKGHARPDSAVSPQSRGSKFSPMTPPSAARLSAVGAIGGFRDERAIDQELGGKKRLTGVRFVDDTKVVNTQDFLLDENESEVIWGL